MAEEPNEHEIMEKYAGLIRAKRPKRRDDSVHSVTSKYKPSLGKRIMAMAKKMFRSQ